TNVLKRPSPAPNGKYHSAPPEMVYCVTVSVAVVAGAFSRSFAIEVASTGFARVASTTASSRRVTRTSTCTPTPPARFGHDEGLTGRADPPVDVDSVASLDPSDARPNQSRPPPTSIRPGGACARATAAALVMSTATRIATRLTSDPPAAPAGRCRRRAG